MPSLSKLFEPESNCPEITKLFLGLINVKVSKTSLKKELEEHPDYPGLLSISDVLRGYNVDNLTASFDAEKLANISAPFITQIRGAKNHSMLYFTVVKDSTANKLTFFDPEKYLWATHDLDAFSKRYTGVVLLAAAEEDAGEKDYLKNEKEERRASTIQYICAFAIPVILLLGSIETFWQSGSTAILSFIYTLLTLSGVIAGILLTWYELDQYNPMLQQICSGGKQINCGAILQSKAAKIFGVNWSSIGLSYFLGSLILSFMWGMSDPRFLFTNALLSTISVPYVFFSVYYQWRVAKQWCLLCLSVQGILALQFSISIFGNWFHTVPLVQAFITMSIQSAFAFALPFIVQTIAVPALRKAKEGRRLKIELQRLKHNQIIFEALLNKQVELTDRAHGLGITLGNQNAKYKIIKVCNPYCGPCAKAHQPIEHILDSNPNVQVQIIFTASNRDDDIAAPPVKHLLAIAGRKDETLLKQALDDWYLAETKDYGYFASRYPMNGELKQQDEHIIAMNKWCKDAKISFTPTFFISMDGTPGKTNERFHRLPTIYSVADLKYFLMQ